MWKELKIRELENNKEYLFYNEAWKTEHNPTGIRIGFGFDGKICTFFYDPEIERYETDNFFHPTHYRHIPKFWTLKEGIIEDQTAEDGTKKLVGSLEEFRVMRRDYLHQTVTMLEYSPPSKFIAFTDTEGTEYVIKKSQITEVRIAKDTASIITKDCFLYQLDRERDAELLEDLKADLLGIKHE